MTVFKLHLLCFLLNMLSFPPFPLVYNIDSYSSKFKVYSQFNNFTFNSFTFLVLISRSQGKLGCSSKFFLGISTGKYPIPLLQKSIFSETLNHKYISAKFVCMCACVRVYLCVCVCVYACVCACKL